MKNLKLFIFVAATAAAFASVATTATATTLSGAGETGLGVGTEIKAESEGHIIYDSLIGNLECNSAFSAKIENSGSSTETAKVAVESLTFTNCTAGLEARVLKNGSLEFHTQESNANSNGTLTSTGTELTVTFSGFHCIYSTSGTDLGTVTGSTTTGGNATLDISAAIPRTGGRSGAFCGSSAPWTGSYRFTTPSTINVDKSPAMLVGEAPTGIIGETFTVTWKNVGGTAAVIGDEANSDSTVAETLGSACGTIAASSSCTSRKFKCLKTGESTLTIRETPEVTGSLAIKCDEPLSGGPTTGTVGKFVTVTWSNNTGSDLHIEDESTSDGTVAETWGSSCGTIGAGKTCTSREIKCLKEGEATIIARDTPSGEGKFVIKCD